MAGYYGGALLIILAHMNNRSSKNKKTKKDAKPNYGSTWNVIHQGCFPGSPPFDSRSLPTFPGPRFLSCPWNAWVLGRPEFFTSNRVYYISIPKMPSPGCLLTWRVGQQANCCRATYYIIPTRWQLLDGDIMDISSKNSAIERKAKDPRHSLGGEGLSRKVL